MLGVSLLYHWFYLPSEGWITRAIAQQYNIGIHTTHRETYQILKETNVGGGLAGVSRVMLSRVMSAYHHVGRTAFNRNNCWRKRKLSERDVQTLTQIVSKKHKTTAAWIKWAPRLSCFHQNCLSGPP